MQIFGPRRVSSIWFALRKTTARHQFASLFVRLALLQESIEIAHLWMGDATRAVHAPRLTAQLRRIPGFKLLDPRDD